MNELNSPEPTVPKAVVSRLSLYLRELQQLAGSGKLTISSSALAARLGSTASQVRKDFAYFGQFGYPGVGYRCEELAEEIRRILGTNRVWPVALIGCGNLGQALLGYRGFGNQGFSVVAAFDTDPAIVGSEFQGLTVQHMQQLSAAVEQHGIRLAVLAVPASAANDVSDAIVAAGISGVLNFAPVTLNLPVSVSVVGVDLAMELEQLVFQVQKQARPN